MTKETLEISPSNLKSGTTYTFGLNVTLLIDGQNHSNLQTISLTAETIPQVKFVSNVAEGVTGKTMFIFSTRGLIKGQKLKYSISSVQVNQSSTGKNVTIGTPIYFRFNASTESDVKLKYQYPINLT